MRPNWLDWIYVCRSIAVFVVFIDQQFVVLCVCGRDILSIFCLSVFLWKSIKGLSWVYEHESLSIWVGAEVDFCTIRLHDTYIVYDVHRRMHASWKRCNAIKSHWTKVVQSESNVFDNNHNHKKPRGIVTVCFPTFHTYIRNDNNSQFNHSTHKNTRKHSHRQANYENFCTLTDIGQMQLNILWYSKWINTQRVYSIHIAHTHPPSQTNEHTHTHAHTPLRLKCVEFTHPSIHRPTECKKQKNILDENRFSFMGKIERTVIVMIRTECSM